MTFLIKHILFFSFYISAQNITLSELETELNKNPLITDTVIKDKKIQINGKEITLNELSDIVNILIYKKLKDMEPKDTFLDKYFVPHEYILRIMSYILSILSFFILMFRTNHNKSSQQPQQPQLYIQQPYTQQYTPQQQPPQNEF